MAAFDAQHGGFATGWSPVSWGSIDELFVNLTMPGERLWPRPAVARAGSDDHVGEARSAGASRKKASGYHRQGRVENAFFRYKSIIGEGLRARSPAGQGSEVVLGCEILNRMTALGRPVSYRIGR